MPSGAVPGGEGGEGNGVHKSNTRHGTTAGLTDSYSGATKFGSGAVSGPGAGNKLEADGDGDSSTLGKLMEKTGGALKNEKLMAKGQEKQQVQA